MDWLHAVTNLNVWHQGGVRAVHKPLLVLMLIARAGQRLDARLPFREAAGPLQQYLREFGPKRRTYHPEMPFWHLQSDGFWVIENAAKLPARLGSKSPTKRTLIEQNATGAIPEPLWSQLVEDARLREDLTRRILDEFWPDTYHASIREAVGLPQTEVITRRRRDPRFREDVIRAYESKCAVCGYGGRLGNNLLGIEAAHIRWHCESGPDEPRNGLALCALHHVALDRGAIGISEDNRILVSQEVSGGEEASRLLVDHSLKPLAKPQADEFLPKPEFTAWHRTEVFKAPARLSRP
ncbi:MAG: HNH endonuclease [Planctomycetes bacterium]|nr:HNH endonuclease [Planctomycetota bacterium]